MLKAKRIAKIILCISIAFSMFISVNADTIIYQVNTYTGNLNQTATSNTKGVFINYPVTCLLYENTNYNFTIYVPNVTVNNYSNTIIRYFPSGYISSPLFFEIKLYTDNIEIMSANNIEIINYNYNNNTFNISFNAHKNVENANNGFIHIYYYSSDTGQNFIIDEPVKPYVIISEKEPSKTEILINNINNTINTIINNINNIFKFVTNKPWIILLGVSVSLISFLIYKAKTII